MTVTFRPEPNELSFVAFDHHIACAGDPRQDRRTFATYEAAVAALADHHPYCRDRFCFDGTRFVLARAPADGEPSLNLSSAHAALLLRALGLRPELDAAPDGDELSGVCDSADLLARIDLALALSPDDPGVPWHPSTPGGRFIDCGRPPGYLHEQLAALREIAVYAHTAHRRVDWC